MMFICSKISINLSSLELWIIFRVRVNEAVRRDFLQPSRIQRGIFRSFQFDELISVWSTSHPITFWHFFNQSSRNKYIFFSKNRKYLMIMMLNSEKFRSNWYNLLESCILNHIFWWLVTISLKQNTNYLFVRFLIHNFTSQKYFIIHGYSDILQTRERRQKEEFWK